MSRVDQDNGEVPQDGTAPAQAEQRPVVAAPDAVPADEPAPPAEAPAASGHTWRWFLAEFVVVALGVLTALGAEQAVQSYHDRQRLEETREAIEAEIMQALQSESLVAQLGMCQQEQFAALDSAVGRGDLARARELMASARLYQALPLSDAAWSTALASGVGNGFDPQERAAYAAVYFLTRQATGYSVDYFRSQERFRIVVGSDLSLSPDAKALALGQLVAMQTIASNQRGLMAQVRFNAEIVLGSEAVEPSPRQQAFIAECEAAAAALAGDNPEV